MTTAFELRDYQKGQLDALYNWWSKHPAIKAPPLIVAPTGSGKSFTIAMIVDRLFDTWPEAHPRTIVLVPSKELAEQNAEKLAAVLPSHISVGYYSASLGKKNQHADVIVATIGSIYRDAGFFGDIRCVIIDEAHLVNPNGGGSYRRFLDDLTKFARFAVVGLTATPFRGNGIWLTQGREPLFAGICHETKIGELIREGYLAPLALPEGGVRTRIDTDDVTIATTGDYTITELDQAVDKSIDDVAREAIQLASDRHRVIAFTPTVASAESLAASLTLNNWAAEVVCGETPKELRAARIADFRAGRIRCLVTVLALATGFDVPDIDCIIWARPSRSPVLYIQGAGRGLRTAPGKSDCLWLDFSDTTDRLGPIDEVQGRDQGVPTNQAAPFKLCPECKAEVRPASSLVCPFCGCQLREEKSTFQDVSEAPILSMHRGSDIQEYDITMVRYYRHKKPGSPDSLRVAYFAGPTIAAQEWVCPQHSGWAGSKALSWLRHRTVDMDALTEALGEADKIEELLELASLGCFRSPRRIRVNKTEKFPRIVGYEFDQDAAA